MSIKFDILTFLCNYYAMICTTAQCNKKSIAKGLCSKCYNRIKRGGTVDKTKRELKTIKICSIPSCGKEHVAYTYCQLHLARYRRHGDPNFINPKCNRDGNSKERLKSYYNTWLKENWANQLAYRKARKNRVKQATPLWADLKEIQKLYLNCPKGHHVDHIIPLFGDNVCGLHVEYNLQYLLAKDNLSKGNRV